MAHAGGAPTKYKPVYCKKIVDYFKKMCLAGDYPTKAGFAGTIDTCKDSITEWAKVHPEFSAALSRALTIAEQCLISGAMQEKFNPGFAKFVAINNCGMISEHSKVDSQSNVIADIRVKIDWCDKPKDKPNVN